MLEGGGGHLHFTIMYDVCIVSCAYSFTIISQVIVALSEKSRTHIPYRNSMMTSVLRDRCVWLYEIEILYMYMYVQDCL